MPIRVLLVEDDDLTRRMMTALLKKQGFEVIPVANGPMAIAEVKTSPPDIILMDVMMPEMDGYTACRAIRAMPDRAHIPIIMLTALDDVDHKVKGFEAGADDYVVKPCDIEELTARIHVLLRPLVQLRGQLSSEEQARAISIFSLRGGAGVTTVAVNLAAGLARLWNLKVLLADMVETAGQTALFLNQALRSTWADLCRAEVEAIDAELLSSVLLPHESGVMTLASPRRPEEGELITAEKVTRVISLLRRQFTYLVFDLPHRFSDSCLACLDQSDVIVLLLQPEIASLRSASIARETFETLQYLSEKKIYVILNWTFPRQGLALQDIERMLKLPVNLILPYAPDEFVTALNLGKPPVLAGPESPLSVIFEDLAFALSLEQHQKTTPANSTPVWRRVIERQRKRKSA
ncbi:MAG: response regulator [Anaerolineales bacterium]|nr:response regulator [Anaerolineales bacterium]MCX7609851.1 response regulator [Anaerolineales bacterium]MDW8227316.1 response regulator [Anaerolineales bacterium]